MWRGFGLATVYKEYALETARDYNLAIIAALLVLFSAMIDPRITIALSLIALVGLLIYKLLESRKSRTES